MYGGIYRDVELIITDPFHISLSDYGSYGLYFTQTDVSREKARILAKILVKGETGCSSVIRVKIEDPQGKNIVSAEQEITFDEQGEAVGELILNISKPHLWNGRKDPFLYKTITELLRKGQITDRVEEKIGIRYFRVDPDKGFFLNDEPLQLRGACRHQDRAEIGNALFPSHHREDMEIMKEMGVNAVRLAHYPQDRYVYDLCDEYGFIVWAEIPFVGPGGYRDKGFVDQPSFRENGKIQLKELIRQNYNHPSICFWGLFNELKQSGDDPLNYVEELNTLAHEEDPYRLTTAASNQNGALNEVTDLIAWNQYYGWYGGEPAGIGKWADAVHKKYPEKPVGISEYGSGASILHQQEELKKPVANSYWHPENWQAFFHEEHWKAIDQRPYLWGTFVWNMFDFGCAARSEGGVTGRNNKGLVTMDRKIKKDSFYLYKAYWNPEPMVHICDKRYSLRSGENTQIRVYTNQERVTLFVNGEEMAVNEVKRHVASFPISLSGGKNAILVKAGDVWDAVTIDRVEKEPESYVFPEASEREEGVANWFQEVGSLNLSEEMKYPEDRYHIRCTLEEISENDEAMELVTKAMKLITGMTLAKGEGMWDMMKKMKLESMKEMLGAMAPDGFLESLNMKLNEIKKENLNG